jgi:hypothetical protein
MKTTHILTFAMLLGTLASAGQSQVFPVDETGRAGVTALESEWYGKVLTRLGESSLAASPANAIAVYRFTVLPTWGNPVCVTLTKSNGVLSVRGKRLDGQGGYDPGKLVEDATVALTAEQAKEFAALFEKLNFTALTTRDKDRGLDGSEWILEVVDRGQYHVVVRWSPAAYDPQKRGTVDFVNVCEWLYHVSPIQGDIRNKGSTEIPK